MIPEPLRGKRYHKGRALDVLFSDDVASAVAWLRKTMCPHGDRQMYPKHSCRYCERIDEAFSDVIMEERE